MPNTRASRHNAAVKIQAAFRAYSVRKRIVGQAREEYNKILEEIADGEAITSLSWPRIGPCFPVFALEVNEEVQGGSGSKHIDENIAKQKEKGVSGDVGLDSQNNLKNTNKNDTRNNENSSNNTAENTDNKNDKKDKTDKIGPNAKSDQNDKNDKIADNTNNDVDKHAKISTEADRPQNPITPIPPLMPSPKPHQHIPASPPPLPPSLLDPINNQDLTGESLQAIKEARRKHLEEELMWARQAIKSRKEHLKLMKRLQKMDLK